MCILTLETSPPIKSSGFYKIQCTSVVSKREDALAHPGGGKFSTQLATVASSAVHQDGSKGEINSPWTECYLPYYRRDYSRSPWERSD